MNKLKQRFSWGGALAKYTTLLFVGLALCLVSFTASAQSSNWKSSADARASLKPVIVAIENSAILNLEIDPQLYANDQAVLNLSNSIYQLIRNGKTTEEAFTEAISIYTALSTPAQGGPVTAGATKPGSTPDALPAYTAAFSTSTYTVTVNPVPTVRSILTQ